MLKTLKINFIVLFGILLFVEITGQVIHLIKWKALLFSDWDNSYRNQLLRRHPYLAVSLRKNVRAHFDEEKKLVITTTEIGTRWTGADLTDTAKIRIACIGGSTTFCTGLNDADTWPALLQKKLGNRYAVINYGFPGYTTAEAIVQMALLIPEMKPKIVVFYQGWNDIHNYYEPESYPDYYWHGRGQVFKVLHKHDDESLLQMLRRKSGFFYIADNICERLVKVEKPQLYKTADSKIDSIYVRNLKTLKTLALSQNAFPVFVPQILNPTLKWEAGTSESWTQHIDNSILLNLLSRFGDLMKKVCMDTDSTCCFLNEIRTDIAWKKNHFLDTGHFSKEGNEIFSDMLSEKIKSIQYNR